MCIYHAKCGQVHIIFDGNTTIVYFRYFLVIYFCSFIHQLIEAVYLSRDCIMGKDLDSGHLICGQDVYNITVRFSLKFHMYKIKTRIWVSLACPLFYPGQILFKSPNL